MPWPWVHVCVFTQAEGPAGRVQRLSGAGLCLRLFTSELYTTGIMPGGINWLDCGTAIVIKNANARVRALASFYTIFRLRRAQASSASCLDPSTRQRCRRSRRLFVALNSVVAAARYFSRSILCRLALAVRAAIASWCGVSGMSANKRSCPDIESKYRLNQHTIKTSLRNNRDTIERARWAACGSCTSWPALPKK